jgi:N-acetylmuramoyl-L-alanine amidase
LKEFQRSVGLDQDGISGPGVYKAFHQLTRTVAGGDPNRLRDELNMEHFSGVSNRSIIMDCTPTNELDPCLDILARTEGKLAVLGSNVVLTSNSSDFDTNKRADLANQIAADVYLHLAQTTYSSDKANGCATFYFSGKPGSTSTRGKRLAELLQNEIVNSSQLGDNRSHGKSWDLLRRTSMPAVMIEIAYAHNTHDQNVLSNPMKREAISVAITKAFTKFYQPDES